MNFVWCDSKWGWRGWEYLRYCLATPLIESQFDWDRRIIEIYYVAPPDINLSLDSRLTGSWIQIDCKVSWIIIVVQYN